MEPLIVALLIVVPIVAGFVALPWILPRAKRHLGRKTQRGILGVVDEIYRPNAHEVAIIAEEREEMPAPAPLPGDKLGKIRIDL